MSRSGKKFGNVVGKELKTKGYEIFPIHPEAKEIDANAAVGELCTYIK